MSKRYSKPWLSYDDQIKHLQHRGLTINNPTESAAFLSHLNYYRFSGYCVAFEVSRHQFASGCTFEDIQAAYEFDRILRDLIADALEPVELDLRTNIAYHFGQRYGAFGHVDATHFLSRFEHAKWLLQLHGETSRSSDLFIRHFQREYSEFPDLPVWVMMEIMSFGSLSKMYASMHSLDQRAIAARYGWQPYFLTKSIHHLTYVRNLCAHHARVWDRRWSISPQMPAGKHWQPPYISAGTHLFATLAILCDLLAHCPGQRAFGKLWRQRVVEHLATPPSAPRAMERMGLTADWKNHPCWQ